jgi:hypothetical protein
MIGACQSSPCMMFTNLSSDSTIFMERSSMVWKNTSDCNAAFLTTALVSSSASVFFALLIYLTVNPLK